MKTSPLLCTLLLFLSPIPAGAFWPGLLELEASRPPHLDGYVFPVAWTPSPSLTNVAGYKLHLGPGPQSMTNWIDLGTNLSATLILPYGQTTYLALRAYSPWDLEGPWSNQLHCPGDEVITATSATGAMLAHSIDPSFSVLSLTPSPCIAVNPQGNRFFRSLDGSPVFITRTIRYAAQ